MKDELTSALIDFFELDSADFDWRDIGSCTGYGDPDLFFEAYEEDPVTAAQVDQICLHCPVIRQCFQQGLKGKETGVWGGVYLENGKVSIKENAHKTANEVKQLALIHGKALNVSRLNGE